jgi:nucleoside-diphosphate-sugar epimerase
MIIAITGGTGFIGHKLVMRHLELGDEVRVLSRRPHEKSSLPDSVRWYYGNLSKSADLHLFVNHADILYHCAGEILDTPNMKSIHVDGTERLIHAATGRIGRWIQLSSVGAYGQHPLGLISEETSLNPKGEYEVTKVQSDKLVTDAAKDGAFHSIILRPSIVYGNEMTNGSLFNLIAWIQRGRFFFIGKPGASANYIHVDNVVKALLLCGETEHVNGQIYNLSDYRSLEDFVGIISYALGRVPPNLRIPESPVRGLIKLLSWMPSIPLTSSRINALTSFTVYQNSKIEQELNYHHEISMEDGLTQLVTYWRSNLMKNKSDG